MACHHARVATYVCIHVLNLLQPCILLRVGSLGKACKCGLHNNTHASHEHARHRHMPRTHQSRDDAYIERRELLLAVGAELRLLGLEGLVECHELPQATQVVLVLRRGRQLLQLRGFTQHALVVPGRQGASVSVGRWQAKHRLYGHVLVGGSQHLHHVLQLRRHLLHRRGGNLGARLGGGSTLGQHGHTALVGLRLA